MKKMKLKKLLLTQEELSKLKGGKRRVDNTNSTSGCNCTYYDAPSAYNNNLSEGCSCECKY